MVVRVQFRSFARAGIVGRRFATNAWLSRVGTKLKDGPAVRARWVDRSVHWWILVLIAAATVILLYGLFRWASADAGTDPDSAKEPFRGERDWRGLHRSAIDAPDRER